MNLKAVSPISQKPISIERRLKSWKIEYSFKWNQSNLSFVLNLSRGSNSLNAGSEKTFKGTVVNRTSHVINLRSP